MTVSRVWPVTDRMIVQAMAKAIPWYYAEPTENAVGIYWCALCKASHWTERDMEKPENHEDNCPWRLAKEAL